MVRVLARTTLAICAQVTTAMENATFSAEAPRSSTMAIAKMMGGMDHTISVKNEMILSATPP